MQYFSSKQRYYAVYQQNNYCHADYGVKPLNRDNIPAGFEPDVAVS